ncbi:MULTISPECIES: hypothetical protein [Cryobacterium]|uniref:DUF4224 domain-containing protein n=1 Tax=Cryobacterium glucosi TaxID=1259175 RepID=A0ABY2ITQ6_9MICO|nr:MULTISPECIES: hypothetical protein [Cryobacterium]TFB96677.1 hypothetical protein E3O39_11530 [Cryobacterium sp. MDB2-A-1]TFC12961.1 hypothetical protein E3O35_08690 [Cryobacterium sp. MDB2-A-2]TFC21418.1 hypothetical protein E3O51_04120 [Cryobacterium sp. MDB2-10]TFC22684.1 hypothetical protein E3O46_04405 [Cryobacterium glucosi]
MDIFNPDLLMTGTLTEASRFASRSGLQTRQWELMEELDAPLRVYRVLTVREMRELAPRRENNARDARMSYSWEHAETDDHRAGVFTFGGWPVPEPSSPRHSE